MRTCPKCDATAGDGPCPRCGLDPAHAATWQARAAEPPTAALGEAWEAALAAWSDEPAHERAAALALASGDYAWLAARYRAVQRERPDDAVARRQLDRLARRAEATLRATGGAPVRPRVTTARIPYTALVVIAVVIATGLFYAMHVLRQRPDDQPTGRIERIAPPPSRR